MSAQNSLPDTPTPAGAPEFDLEASFGFVVTQVGRRMTRELNQQLQPFGVTAAQWLVLAVLWQQDGLAQNVIADLIGSDRPTLTAILKLMTAQGLVRRNRDKDDNRFQRVYLTPAGQRLRTALPPLAIDVNNTAMAGFSTAERATLVSLLNRVRANLGSGSGRLSQELLGGNRQRP